MEICPPLANWRPKWPNFWMKSKCQFCRPLLLIFISILTFSSSILKASLMPCSSSYLWMRSIDFRHLAIHTTFPHKPMHQNRHTWQTPAFPQSYNFCQQDIDWSVLSWKKDLTSLWKLLMHTWIPQKFPSLREVKGQPCKRGQSWSAAGSLPLLRAKVHSCSQLLPSIMVTKLAKDAWLSKKLTSLVCYKPILRKAVIIPEGQKRVVNIIFHLYLKPYFATASSPCICSRIFTLSDPPTRPTVALGITWLVIIIFCTHALYLISRKIDLLFHEVSHFFWYLLPSNNINLLIM